MTIASNINYNYLYKLLLNFRDKINYTQKFKLTLGKISSITGRLEKITSIQENTLKEFSANEDVLKNQITTINYQIAEYKNSLQDVLIRNNNQDLDENFNSSDNDSDIDMTVIIKRERESSNKKNTKAKTRLQSNNNLPQYDKERAFEKIESKYSKTIKESDDISPKVKKPSVIHIIYINFIKIIGEGFV